MNATTERIPKALLLDGDDAARRPLAEALTARGFEVVSAADGDSGVALLLEHLLDLDVLVTAIDLPGRDAWSLLHLVRVAGGERDLRVAVTAAGATAALAAGLAVIGADVVLDAASGAETVAAGVDALVRDAHAAPAEPGLCARLAGCFPAAFPLALRPAA